MYPHDSPPRPPMPTNFVYFIKQVRIKVFLAILEIINFKYLHTYIEEGKGAHGGKGGKYFHHFFSYTPLISPLNAFQNTFAIFCLIKNVAVMIFWKKSCFFFANLAKTANFDCPLRAKKKWGGGHIFFFWILKYLIKGSLIPKFHWNRKLWGVTPVLSCHRIAQDSMAQWLT